MAEIRISYNVNPKGQVGARPQKIAPGEECTFILLEPGKLEITFIDGSPAADDKLTFEHNGKFTAKKPGPQDQRSFQFKCKMTDPQGKEVEVGDPNVPRSGGEIEIGK